MFRVSSPPAFPAFLIALAAGLPCAAGVVTSVRPIQVDYPSDTGKNGGVAIALWETEGPFDEVRVAVDATVVSTVSGSLHQGTLGLLPLGTRVVEVQGVIAGEVASRLSASLEVLTGPPHRGVEPAGCIFFGYRSDQGGYLEFFWKNRDTPELPYFDLGITVNGSFQGVLKAPASSLRFSRVPLGPYAVEVVAYTLNHLCPPAVIDCSAQQVGAVTDAACDLDHCEERQGVFRVRYTIPLDVTLDGLAVYDITADESGVLLGKYGPGEPITISGVEEGHALQVELVSFYNDSASTLPSFPGQHVITTCSLPVDGCLPPLRFRRGDCNGDARQDISDDIFNLNYLFTGGEPPPCAAACDFDGDGRQDISDAISSLSFKFLGGPGPALPFPTCGGRSERDLECNTGCAP